MEWSGKVAHPPSECAAKERKEELLWGLGQRLYFLHGGRASPGNGSFVTAILDHASSGSEANAVVSNFQHLTQQQQQDLLNFLRSL